MRRIRLPVLLIALALALYVPTWCPVVTWVHEGQDGPELEAAGRALGVPHPTGYPLLMLLIRMVAVFVPPPVSALNVVSLLAAILAVVAAGLAARAVARGIWGVGVRAEAAGFVAGALFATSLTWWKQSVIGEAYTLHLAIEASVLALLFAGGARRAILAAWVLGLGLAHHLQIVPFLVVAAAYWIAARRGKPPPAAAIALLAPLSLYAGLVLRARGDPALNWGNPDTLGGLWWTLSGAPYHGNVFDGGFVPFAGRLADALLHGPATQLGWGGAALALSGIAVAARRAPSAALALLLLFAGTSAVAAAYAISDPAAYYLPASLALAVFAGLGGAAFVSEARRRSIGPRVLRLAAPAASLAAVAACLAAQIVRVAPEADAHRDHEAYLYARDGVRALEPNALVLSHGDGRTFSLWYGASVLSPRPDVAILYDNLLDWPWYRAQVARRHPGLLLPPIGQSLPVARAILIERTLGERPVYVTALESELTGLFTVEPAGPLYRVSRLPRSGGAAGVRGAAIAGASSGTTDREALHPAGSTRRSP